MYICPFYGLTSVIFAVVLGLVPWGSSGQDNGSIMVLATLSRTHAPQVLCPQLVIKDHESDQRESMRDFDFNRDLVEGRVILCFFETSSTARTAIIKEVIRNEFNCFGSFLIHTDGSPHGVRYAFDAHESTIKVRLARTRQPATLRG